MNIVLSSEKITVSKIDLEADMNIIFAVSLFFAMKKHSWINM